MYNAIDAKRNADMANDYEICRISKEIEEMSKHGHYYIVWPKPKFVTSSDEFFFESIFFEKGYKIEQRDNDYVISWKCVK